MRLIYSVGHPDGTTAGSWSATSITSALWFVFPGGRSWHSALTGRGTGIKESILPLSSSHLTTLFLSLVLSTSHIPLLFSLSFQLCPSDLFASPEEEAMWCGCTRCRLTPHRITWVELYARSYFYVSVSTFRSESYSLRPHTPLTTVKSHNEYGYLFISLQDNLWFYNSRCRQEIQLFMRWMYNLMLRFIYLCFACKDGKILIFWVYEIMS